MATEIDFQPYLRSLSEHYAQWWQLYTLTDAETRAQQQNEPQPWKTPFDFGLMVQTVAKGALGPDEPGADRRESQEKVERFPVLEGIRKYVAEHRQVLLVGRPGSGKSTTLARLLLEEAGAGQSIPVLVELRFWQTSVVDLIRDFFKRHQLLLDRTQIEDLLFHRRLLLLIDGLNELPSEAARLDVAKFRQDYPKVSMIFTTRDLSLGGDFGLEKKLEIKPLTEAQMQAFVRSYVPEQTEAMLRQLKDRLRKFGQTPLLLWMLCGLFRQTGQIPANLGEVFRAFTQGYERNLKADVPVESDRRWWPDLLQELAFWMMRGVPFGEEAPAADVEFRVATSKVEAHRIFADFLQNKEAEAEGVAQKCLEDLLLHHLIQLNGEHVEFRHQLLQEYYAAEYLLAHWDRISEFEFKRDYLNYLKWTESISLIVGLTNNEELALQIVKFARGLDLRLGARLAGEVKPELQPTTVSWVSDLDVAEWLKISLLRETQSDVAVPGLLKALEDEYYLVRRSAVEALGQIGSEQAILGLLEALEDEYPGVRWSATKALGQIGSEQAILGLLKALEHENSGVRWSAVEVLGQIGSEQAILGLLKALEDEDSGVRRSAVEALGQIGSEKVIPGLLKALEHENYLVRRSALVKFGSEQEIRLFKAVEHDKSRVCQIAVQALVKIGSEQAIPGLLKALEDEDSDVRQSTAYALGQIGSEQAIPGLLKALENIPLQSLWEE